MIHIEEDAQVARNLLVIADSFTLLKPIEAKCSESNFVVYQTVTLLECWVDALLVEVYHEECDAHNLTKYGCVVREIERELNQLKALKDNRNKKLYLELSDITVEESNKWLKEQGSNILYWRDKYRYENCFIYDDPEANNEPLYVGETLRMKINDFLKKKELALDFPELEGL